MESNRIKDGMIELYKECQGFSQKFKKKLYQVQMEDLCADHQDLFLLIKEGIEESEESMKEICTYLPQYVLDEMTNIKSKNRKEVAMIDYNLTMVSYFVPVLGKIDSAKAKAFTEELVAVWNEMLPGSSIKRSTSEEIQSGFRTGLCYITTAVCESLDKPDDCYELTMLRDYRDEYLLSTEDGTAVVHEYYDIAPTIVKRIEKEAHAEEIYNHIWTTYLQPCVSLIESGEKEECKDLYTDMVKKLEAKYLYS
ncbi:hypothetical protein SAMN02745243_01783 [Hespellia stercorisuis DSM 15480]|uniref:Uncharacterized protein n=2 Tax=Hespellia stercorisuis TaxID=180311 RepID=A0A1M6NCI8_9FIRM|nr:hypothetical protein SAMN02745243_01783 [Hespellia stercorisuis DSM 15480]